MLAPWKESYDIWTVYYRNITFPTKIYIVKAMVFFSSHVWTWELDHKEARVKELMLSNCGLAEDSWESLGLQDQISQSQRKITEYSLEGLMLKLKLQYSGHLMGRADSLEKTPVMGKTEGRRRRGWQRARWHHWHNGHEFAQTLGNSKGQGSLECCSPWARRFKYDLETEQQQVCRSFQSSVKFW